MIYVCYLSVDSAQFRKVTICRGRVCTVGGFVIYFQGTGEFVEAIVGAAEDIAGAHPLVGIAVAVEIADKVFGQRVVQHRLAATVLLFQLL